MSWAAMVLKNLVITWPGVFVMLGALCAVLGCMALWLARGNDPGGLAVFFPAAILFSLVLGRLIHWYCHPLQYAGFAAAMTDYFRGGFSLSGAFAGALLSALLVRGAGLIDDLAELLDAAAPAGALGIAVGRLGSLYDLSDRGKMAVENPALRRLPFAVYTSFTEGTGEWRFATFALQALTAAVLAAVLTWVFFRLARRRDRTDEKVGGRVFALFLALYGASQTVLDSTRYDADFFRANGFVHLPQVLSAAALALSLVWLSVLSVRKNGLRWQHGVLWALCAGCLGAGGWMEYFVQRRADRAALAYGVMAGCLLLAAVAAAALCVSLREKCAEEKGEKKSRRKVDKRGPND